MPERPVALLHNSISHYSRRFQGVISFSSKMSAVSIDGIVSEKTEGKAIPLRTTRHWISHFGWKIRHSLIGHSAIWGVLSVLCPGPVPAVKVREEPVLGMRTGRSISITYTYGRNFGDGQTRPSMLMPTNATEGVVFSLHPQSLRFEEHRLTRA